WIIAAVLTYKLALWAYQGYQESKQEHQQQEVLEFYKVCWIDADTRRCMCRHRQTKQRISMAYDECVSRASTVIRP
ncbi:MAG: hypothetical protein ACE1Y4_18420, partial [Lysobacterales bacterium]